MIRCRRFIFLPLIALVFNCSDDNPTGPSSDNFRYPLHIGNEWNYDRHVSLTFDLTSGVRPSEVTKSGINVKVIGEEMLFNSINAVKVEEQGFNHISMWANTNYYQNRGDGLYLISGMPESTGLPKHASKIKDFLSPRIAWTGSLLGSFLNIELDADNDPKIVLKYPLKRGTQWIYTEQNKPRRITKKVVGKVDVKTNAGTFKTVKVQWIVDFDGDGEFDSNVEYFDYIANEGLVKRTFLIRNLPVVDDDGGNIGSYDYHDESLLTSFVLK